MKRLCLTILILLSITLFLNISVRSESLEGSTIEEILILGNTRTPDRVILNQLPFTIGDSWEERFTTWTYRRLVTLNIFSYEPLTILTEPLEEGCRVIIRVADPPLLYKDPAEYLFTMGIGFAYQNLYQLFNNPFGSGQNIGVGIDWGPNHLYRVQVSSPLGPGLFQIGVSDYRRDRSFLEHMYTSHGSGGSISYRYWPSPYVRQTTSLHYSNNQLNQKEQELLVPSVEFFYDRDVLASLKISTGLSHREPFYRKESVIMGEYGPFYGLMRGGLVTENTPLNYRFSVGSFSPLPLRGEPIGRLTTGYLLFTGEYHGFFKGFIPLLFMDLGLLMTEYREPISFDETIINLGIGLAYETPLGLPVRLDIGTNLNDGGIAWHIGFGHSFSPPF